MPGRSCAGGRRPCRLRCRRSLDGGEDRSQHGLEVGGHRTSKRTPRPAQRITTSSGLTAATVGADMVPRWQSPPTTSTSAPSSVPAPTWARLRSTIAWSSSTRRRPGVRGQRDGSAHLAPVRRRVTARRAHRRPQRCLRRARDEVAPSVTGLAYTLGHLGLLDGVVRNLGRSPSTSSTSSSTSAARWCRRRQKHPPSTAGTWPHRRTSDWTSTSASGRRSRRHTRSAGAGSAFVGAGPVSTASSGSSAAGALCRTTRRRTSPWSSASVGRTRRRH